MKISTNLDKKSEQAFHEGSEAFVVLHAAVNLLLYRGLKYCFAVRGMVLLPKQMEITGSIAEILVTITDNNAGRTLWAVAWSKALSRCSRSTISFFHNGVSEPQYDQGHKGPRFSAQVHLFEKNKKQPFFEVDMMITKLRLPSSFFAENGPDYRLDGSLKWLES